MKEVLITGGAGFVGSNLAKMIRNEHGAKVTILDDFFTGSEKNLTGLDVEVVKGSVLNADLLMAHTRNKDVIFHLAARNIIASSQNPYEDLTNNIIGTYNVLQACKQNQVKRMVYTSTSSVYGNAKHIPVNEDDGINLLNFYSVSKYAGEGYAKTFYEQYNLPVSIVRYSNVFGINQAPSNPYCGVIGKFIQKALTGEPLLIHGDGEQTRDYTFVEDACRATILAALDQKAIGEVFNIGTGVETSVNNLAKAVLEITGGKSEHIQYIDKRDIDNIRRRVLNIEKIRYKLKFFPQITLKDGLARTIKWQKETGA
ncbi:MAG TPA: NAD-dependent epimerase/dehydratase family protein [Bacteroidia bacterium]|jgi:UDP-glucose 4-epimerase|nr:NAD-dependent epimerase/dehydratase family protein [Bacteroidia bacterium]